MKAFIGVIVLIGFDQLTKYFVSNQLELYAYHPIFGDLFGLYYLENKGMAWGMFQNKQAIFLILTFLVIGAVSWCYVKLLQNVKFRPLNICIVFLVAGAIGNMIDRIFHGDILFQGGVIDFLYIKCIDFPVFNVADMFVTFSIGIAAILILFYYKEQDFQMVFGKSTTMESSKETSITDSVMKTEPDAVIEPVTKSATSHVTNPVAKPATSPVTKSATNPVANPVTEALGTDMIEKEE